MKKIYIVLTYSGTMLSKIIKGYTKDEFAHVSISLDRELNEMYSFGRLNPYNPFIGGFVQEYMHKGTFKRFYNTKAGIYSLDITDEQYENIKRIIKQIEMYKSNYKFNLLGLFAAGFRIRLSREYYFYCAEFVKYVIEKADVCVELPNAIKPEDFKQITGLKNIYKGFLRSYQIN
jgi:hypothetical protein